MIHEANTTRWKPRDMVLHDADAKRPEMLMTVLGYNQDGRCRTCYATANQVNGDERRDRPRVWENPIAALHDPARFGIPANNMLTVSGGREKTNDN